MKKALALLICVIFVLSASSFAFWGIGEKKSKETKTKIMTKGKKQEKKVVVKKAATKKVMKKEVKKPATKKK
jgi:Na+-transporting methylmalonyl-CoA/oxaloacetate decarboxylase gamma subunit